MDEGLSAGRLPSDHHVGLHCSPKSFSIEKDAEGLPVGVNSSVFRVDVDGISVNWLEHEGNTPEEQFYLLCATLIRTRSVKNSHRVGIMQVLEIEQTGTDEHPVHVEHDPLIDNPGHSLIKGLDPNDNELLHDLTLIVELREFVHQAPQANPQIAQLAQNSEIE